ncbi:MAG: glycosyltransferase family 1 protein [Jatrophihabitans sp.]|nr:MAG: glycosyltransferase family 1 protein [Jatrophihabitans sp.]
MTAPRRTLIVTNDFPPRQGGIQSFVHELAIRQPAGSVVVYSSDYAGAREFDAAAPFPVERHRSGLLLPTPAAARRAVRLLREYGCTAVWFGASAPLGLLAPALRRAGAQRIVASSHGHEIGWAMLPGARQVLRRIGRSCDVITYLGEYTRSRIEPALGARSRMQELHPGVDADTFSPGVSGSAVRERHGLAGRPVVVCVSRLVPRKGQDVLIEAMPAVRRAVPGAALLIVGRGPYRDHLERLAARRGVAGDVVFTGGVAFADLPAHYAAGDVFAMPCRTRRAGMDVEGLGIVYLEASAVGLPVLAGASGGAPDAVREGETGYVVDGRDAAAVASRLVTLLQDAPLRGRLGAAGRAWVEREWRWDVVAARLRALLDG